MKNRRLKRFWIYVICITATAVLMFLLNYILRLPVLVPIIGDENTWLPIIADAIVASAIFIAGNWFSNEDRLRNEISCMKEDYKVVQVSVSKIQSALNIRKRMLYFIYSLDANMNSRSLLSEIMQVQQGIDDSINSFEQIKYTITSPNELEKFESKYKELRMSFQIVLDGLMKSVNDWCDIQAKSTQAGVIADLIGTNSNKLEYATLYAEGCTRLEKSKNKFLDTYKEQEDNLNNLLNTLDKSAKDLLDAEIAIIKNLESNL